MKMDVNKKIISYSLYGNNPRYTLPLLENSKIAISLYQGWTIYVYHNNTVNQDYLDQLKQNGVVTINIEKINQGNLPPKMWRFLPIQNLNVDFVIFRDADSMLTHREHELVIEWEQSDKLVHIIRDHPLHIAPILAGMFGMKKNSFHILSKLMQLNAPNVKSRPVDYDQVFLADFFYPKINKQALIHVSFFKYWGEHVIKIKPVSDSYNYIGSVLIDDEIKKEKEKNILISSKFKNGIPYFVSKLLRYRVRPVIYSSLISNYIYNITKSKSNDYEKH